MTESAIRALGGLAFFLLGMLTMTEGLRGLAGAGLERALHRLTRSPASGALTAALFTALIQSSSATIVLAIGLVGSGVLEFASAIGIVLGSNVGTTVTGWLVAMLGLDLELANVAPVALFVGVLARLFARGRARNAGAALAGFALLFLGIDALRTGLASFESVVRPSHFPPDTWTGRLELVGIGAAITLVTQSSSAGVALAIVALSQGIVVFPQAAALVIGMDVATTATAAIATIGASLPARRTGLAHVFFNLLTGVFAFALLPVYARAMEQLAPELLGARPEIALVGFHTLFNVLGVAAMLPFAQPFARAVEFLVRERAHPFTRRLERRLLTEPAIAARALGPTLEELARETFDVLADEIANGERELHRLEPIERAVAATQEYLAAIPIAPRRPSAAPSIAEQRVINALHCLDRLGRLIDRGRQRDRIESLRSDAALRELAARVEALLREAASATSARTEAFAKGAAELEASEHAARERFIAESATGRATTEDTLRRMDAHRWAERVAHHAWRIAHHLDALAGRASAST